MPSPRSFTGRSRERRRLPATSGLIAPRETVPARRIGPLAARALGREGSGRVVGLHRRAANLLLGDGSLVAILPVDAPLHPWAITAEIDLGRLVDGAPAEVAPGAILFESLVIEFSPAIEEPLVLARRPASILPDWLAALERALDAVDRRGDRFVASIAPVVERVAARGDLAELAALVGLGEGLTPSGDDILVGALAAFDFASDASPKAARDRAEAIAAIPSDLEARTPCLSAQMIRAAAAGLYAEPLLALFESAELPAPESTEAALAALLVVGHRTGGDVLLGVVTALRRLSGQSAPPFATIPAS